MKTTHRLFTALVVMLLFFNFNSISAQDDGPQGPQYVTATTMHWNMNYENFKLNEWKEIEKEYLDNVTMKNEHIMGASFYLHQFTKSNSELVYVQTYATWDDIDKAGARDTELAKEAWPDDDARSEFFKKRNAYYDNRHSDEIYATMSGAKLMDELPLEDMTCYVRTSHFAFPEDGTNAEFKALRDEYNANVTQKNEHIKAYYPNMHAWGADRTEYLEAFFVDKLADLDDMFSRNGELFREHWTDADAREAFSEKNGKYYTGEHGDNIYHYVAGLSK